MNDSNSPRVAGTVIPTFVLSAVLLAVSGCDSRTNEEPQQARAHDASHEGKVHLDDAQLEAAGIETVAAGPGAIEETLHLVARVASNENAIVHVTPRIEGIVQAIHKGLGEHVKAGEPLADIWSVELGNRISSYLKARATALAAEETLAKSEDLYRKRLETVTTVLDGEIAVARKICQREQKLQEKGIATIRPYLAADQALQKAVLAKDRELTTLAAERDTRLLELDVALRQARIEETAAKERLFVLGFDEQQIEAFASAGHQHGRIVLRAPQDGVVLARHITLNEHVDTKEALFVIHDLSTVWVLASAYEKDLTRLHPGQKCYVRLDALPGTQIVGEVSILDYQVSATTRSASVRIELANEPIAGWPVELPLRPGMFGEVEIVVDSRTGRIVLPEVAIVHEGQGSFVFVREKREERAFRRKPVEVRRGARGLVEIVDGIDPGEAVVVEGTFTLKSLARSEELGEGHSH